MLDVGVFHDIFGRVKGAKIVKLKFPLFQVRGCSTIGQNLVLTNMCRHLTLVTEVSLRETVSQNKTKNK